MWHQFGRLCIMTSHLFVWDGLPRFIPSSGWIGNRTQRENDLYQQRITVLIYWDFLVPIQFRASENLRLFLGVPILGLAVAEDILVTSQNEAGTVIGRISLHPTYRYSTESCWHYYFAEVTPSVLVRSMHGMKEYQTWFLHRNFTRQQKPALPHDEARTPSRFGNTSFRWQIFQNICFRITPKSSPNPFLQYSQIVSKPKNAPSGCSLSSVVRIKFLRIFDGEAILIPEQFCGATVVLVMVLVNPPVFFGMLIHKFVKSMSSFGPIRLLIRRNDRGFSWRNTR